MLGNGLSRYWHLPCRLVGIAASSLVGFFEIASASVVDFEDLPLAPESFYNGADGTGGFSSSGAFFNNTFTDFGGGVTIWSGWSYSNITDNTTPGFMNQYSTIPGTGADGSPNYAVAFAFDPGDATIELPVSLFPDSMFIANTTYAYQEMLNGSQFSKVFGGQTGDDPDFFLLTITGLDSIGGAIGTIDFYLADYRFEDNSLDYLIDSWTEVDLTGLDGAATLSFGLTSSDVGQFGMNTPAYFAIDNLHVVPEPTTMVLLLFGGVMALRRKTARYSRFRFRVASVAPSLVGGRWHVTLVTHKG